MSITVPEDALSPCPAFCQGPARNSLLRELRLETTMRHLFCSTSVLVALVCGSTLLAGCATHYIPNTDVEESDENRKLITFCERYRHAVEQKDIATLLKLAAPNYYEDGGNIDPIDDIDYAGLEAYLRGKFQTANGIRYEIRYRRIQKDRDLIFVDYSYSASYRIPGTKADEWHRKVEDNRLELIPFQDEYRIVAGM
jgi:hypothetical protein